MFVLGRTDARNYLIQAESNFDLQIGGDLRKPEVVGRLRVFEGGRLRFRDIDYRIESATLDFLELDRIDPLINLRATTNIEQYQVGVFFYQPRQRRGSAAVQA